MNLKLRAESERSQTLHLNSPSLHFCVYDSDAYIPIFTGQLADEGVNNYEEADDRPSVNGLYFYGVIYVNADVCVMINQIKVFRLHGI